MRRDADMQAIWAKGYTELLDLMDKHKRRGEPVLMVDCYGSGEDLDDVRQTAHLCCLPHHVNSSHLLAMLSQRACYTCW